MKDKCENCKLRAECSKMQEGKGAKRDEIKLIDRLAELEHAQWIQWSMNLAEHEYISEKRENRWEELWCPYSELSEEMKEEDRKWARKVLKIICDTK